jgi:hypothetical protein
MFCPNLKWHLFKYLKFLHGGGVLCKLSVGAVFQISSILFILLSQIIDIGYIFLVL